MSDKYDLVLSRGTILDPANDFEGVSDVAISDGKVQRIAPELDPGDARQVIYIEGKWVMPGQIDTHAHVAGLSRNWDPALGHGMLAAAGTTTVLDMGGTGPNLIDGIRRRGAGLNVAGLFALIPGATIPPADPSAPALRDIVAGALGQGCIGVKILGGYHPFSPETTADVIAASNEQHAYVAFHIGTRESGSHLGGVREIPELVGKGRLHVCHVNSYCRGVVAEPDEECNEALSILEGMRGQINSEVYHAVQNGTTGRCGRDGEVLADVPRNCLRLKGYPATREGMREALLDGYGSVVAQKGNEVVYVTGKDGLEIYEQADTNVGMSFPVNVAASAFTLTTAKDKSGEFIADAVSTDGGSHPRNVAIESTMALVKFGALTPLEAATKLSWTPARMLGLTDKGHFTPGADADITVVDPSIGKAVMSFVAGKPIMENGKVVGEGGTLLVTAEGEATAQKSGIPYQVIDLSRSKLYAGQ